MTNPRKLAPMPVVAAQRTAPGAFAVTAHLTTCSRDRVNGPDESR
jgi:hypothetical protein